jgi:hypothetical protein
VSGFFNRQATEVSQFHNPALLGVESREFGQSVIQRDQVQASPVGLGNSFIQRKFPSPIPLSRVSIAGIFDQDLPHQSRCYGKKMCSVFEVRLLLHEAEIRLIDQRCTLKSVPLAFRLKVMMGDPP